MILDLRALSLLALLLLQTAPRTEQPVATPEHLRYQRAITVPHGTGQACVALDGQVFPHAAPSLKDLRIFPASTASSPEALHEVPYAITLSEAVTEETQPARILNLGAGARRNTTVSFDLEMPDAPYTDVVLELEGKDFLATAAVWGSNTPGAPEERSTALGIFTLFDLSSQHLSRDTTLPLSESTFRYLHISLDVSPAPGAAKSAPSFGPAMVKGAQVPPSREAQTIYTTVATTSVIATHGRESRAEMVIPARVPVERVTFELAPLFKGNFSRDVRITATADKTAPANESDTGKTAAEELAASTSNARESFPEIVTGTIQRVHVNEAGREIRTQELSIPAILGANLQRQAKVQVALENGDDQPLPIAAVRLEMRQRKLCFDAPTDASLMLYYGDPDLPAPVYDYDRLFQPSEKPLLAMLGPELLNPIFHPQAAPVRPFTERHPEVLWIALIGVICVLGVVALRSAKTVHPN